MKKFKHTVEVVKLLVMIVIVGCWSAITSKAAISRRRR